MATNTPNLSLVKPELQDNFDLKLHLNDNWDKIDTAISGKVDNTVGLKFALKNNIDDCTDDKTLYRVYINDGSVSKGYHNLICINQTYKKAQYLFAQDGKIQFRVSSRKNDLDEWSDWSEWSAVVNDTDLSNALATKADKSTTYDKSEIDNALSTKIDNVSGTVKTNNIASKAVTNDKLADEVKTSINNKADKETSYTKSEVDTKLSSKPDKATTLGGYGITDAYTSEKVDELLTKLGTKNFSFLRDSFGRIIDYTRDTRITSTSFKLYNSNDLSKGYSAWFGKTVTYVENGALDTANLKEIVCENKEAVLESDYDDVKIAKGENPYSEYYKLVSLARLYNEKADKATTLAGYGITDAYTSEEVDTLLTEKADKENVYTKADVDCETKNNMQEIVNTLPKCMLLPDADNTRALYVDGRYLYNCHATNRAVTKCDIGIETDPKNIETIGGHPKTYPRGMAAGNGYLYVPYRDTQGGTRTSFEDEDVGGYLDTINLSNFSVSSTIAYPREPYDPGDGRGTRYYGKSHNAATYNNKYLCVTQQLGGWLLYDISENPVIDDKVKPLYKCDNRAQSTIDNTEFQQPAFYTDGTMVFLAITGYDRHLLKIYNLNDPTYPICVYSGDLRELWQHGNTAYLHTMGLVCRYPYIYCTVAPFPDSETVKYSTDFENTMQGVAVVDVSDINRVKVNFYKIPDESRTINSGGEPSPQSIAVTKNHLVMDMFDKGVSVWSLANPAEPKFLGNLDTGATKVCSVLSTEDGRTFVGTEYQGGNLTMYRGI
jgi:hypothetical protein